MWNKKSCAFCPTSKYVTDEPTSGGSYYLHFWVVCSLSLLLLDLRSPARGEEHRADRRARAIRRQRGIGWSSPPRPPSPRASTPSTPSPRSRPTTRRAGGPTTGRRRRRCSSPGTAWGCGCRRGRRRRRPTPPPPTTPAPTTAGPSSAVPMGMIGGGGGSSLLSGGGGGGGGAPAVPRVSQPLRVEPPAEYNAPSRAPAPGDASAPGGGGGGRHAQERALSNKLARRALWGCRRPSRGRSGCATTRCSRRRASAPAGRAAPPTSPSTRECSMRIWVTSPPRSDATASCCGRAWRRATRWARRSRATRSG